MIPNNYSDDECIIYLTLIKKMLSVGRDDTLKKDLMRESGL